MMLEVFYGHSAADLLDPGRSVPEKFTWSYDTEKYGS
jgi:hypothetical protein